MHEDARAGGADLPLIHEGAEHDALRRAVEIGVREHDLRILAAEFERELLGRRRRRRHHRAPGLHRTGERNLADIRMRDDREPCGLPASGQDVDDAGRQAFGDQLGHFHRRDRGRFRRLVDHRIADRDGGRDLAEEHVDREIPRADDADDAERLAIIEAQDIAGIDASCLRARGTRRRNSAGDRPRSGYWPCSRARPCRYWRSRARRSGRLPPADGRRAC